MDQHLVGRHRCLADMGKYVLATTTETDEKGPKTAGAINGGFFEKESDWPM